MNRDQNSEAARLNRRRFMTLSGAVAASAAFAAPALLASPAEAASQAAQRIADHFSSVKTMAGEFVQFGPRGEQTGGKFFIQRPGRVRFNYDKPSPIRVIADGKSVVIGNQKLKTWDVYPLSKTPLNLLLSERIDLNSGVVKSVKEDADLTTIVLGDRSIFGDSKITMMFDPQTYELRQWTITDAQGKDTSVMIFNVKTGLTFGKKVFQVPYKEITTRGASMR